MTKNFPKLITDTKSQIQEAQKVQTRINPQKPIPRHIIFKLKKIKNQAKILKEARGRKHLTYREAKIRTALDFSSESMEARREWRRIYSVERKKSQSKFYIL